jgi:hypothetical protein
MYTATKQAGSSGGSSPLQETDKAEEQAEVCLIV